MKAVSIILAIAILAIFVVAGALSVMYLGEISSGLPPAAGGPDAAPGPRSRAIVLLPDKRDPFFNQLAASLEASARGQGIALEFRPLSLSRDRQSALRTLELAILAHPQGLVITGSADPDYVRLINQAVASRVPVITVASDSPASKRQTFVGTNGFSLGSLAGRLAVRYSRPGARVGVILGRSDPAAGENGDPNILAGLAQALAGPEGRQLTEARSSRPGLASGDEIASDLLGRHPELSVLFCSSAKDTLAAAQILVDQNRVGQVVIIGVDDPPEIRDYLEKGVISATIVRNPVILGQLAIKSLAELQGSGYSSGFADPGLDVLTRSDLDGH